MHLAVTFLLFTVLVLEVQADLSSRIAQCVQDKVQIRRKREKSGKTLFINFGYSGVEAVQAFGPLATRQTQALVDCVQAESAAHFRVTK
jgi:hypothetical protein